MRGELLDFLKKFRWKFAFIVLVSVFTLGSVVYILSINESKVLLPEEMSSVGIEGYYSIDGGLTYSAFKSIEDVDKLFLRNVIVKGHFTKELCEDCEMYMFLNNIDCKIYVNGESLYKSDPDVIYCWAAIKNVNISQEDEVIIELHTRNRAIINRSFGLFFNRLCIATKASVLSSLLHEYILRILGVAALFVLGLCMWVYLFELRMIKTMDTNGVFACGLTLVMGAFTTLINPNFITLLLPHFDALDYLDSVTQLFTIFFALVYLRRYIVNEKRREYSGKLMYFALLCVFLYMVFSVFKINTGISLTALVMIPGLVIMIVYLFTLGIDYIEQRNNLQTRMVVITSLLLILFTLFEMLYFLFTGVYMIDMLEIGLLIFGITQYFVIVKENVNERLKANRARELENELMQSQINIMISQIQPHFLYNALGTIRALCTKDPEEARNAMDFFAKYLRANMESLNKSECVPFTKELEHVKSYLYIEKLRFGDLLHINYEIEATDFVIPAMTVQTLTENAVKHGLLGKEDGGTVTIRTRETANCFEVQIEDDGVGFDTTKKFDDSRTHVGIENSRQRLAGMCGGNLSIGSKVGVGTVITITIPKE